MANGQAVLLGDTARWTGPRVRLKTLVLGGISTNIGVESTARAGYELGYALVLAEDAMSCASLEHHHASVNYIFPRLGLVRQSEDVIQALAD